MRAAKKRREASHAYAAIVHTQVVLTLRDDWLELALSAAFRHAVSTTSLMSSCISRVTIVRCICRR